jgi:hypothetical protein
MLLAKILDPVRVGLEFLIAETLAAGNDAPFTQVDSGSIFLIELVRPDKLPVGSRRRAILTPRMSGHAREDSDGDEEPCDTIDTEHMDAPGQYGPRGDRTQTSCNPMEKWVL